MPNFVGRLIRSVVVAPGGTQTVDLPVNGTSSWSATVAVSGVGALDTMTVATSVLGTDIGAAVAATGLPVASGASASIWGIGQPCTFLRVVAGSTLGCTLTFSEGAWGP